MDSSKFTLHLLHHTVNATGSPSNSAAPDDPNPNDSDQFEQRLFDLTDQLSSSGYSQASVLNNLVVESAVVGQQHLAFLLDNGHVCRLNYQFNGTISGQTTGDSTSAPQPTMSSSSSRSSKHSKLSTLSPGLSSGLGSSSSTSSSFRPSSRTISSSSFVAAAAAAVAAASTGPTTGQQSASSGNSTGSANQLSGSSSSSSGSSTANNTGTTSSGGLLRANEAFIIPSPHDILSSSSLSHGFGRGRRNQLLRSRVSNLIVGSSRMPPFVPASAVPESLIESVQTVLQSKSRSVIIRELQRTNLDVNLAVNNLLQRDDEGDDPTDDEDPYMHGDDLISLLDINSHHGESVLLEADGALFDEDSFRLSRRLGSGRTHGSSTTSVITSGSNANSGATNTSNTGSHSSSSAGNNNTNNSGSSSEPIERESSSRKSSYRIRDQRWYDSYRDELFTSANSSTLSSSSHHHRTSGSSHHGNSNVDSNSSTSGKQEEDKKRQQFLFGDQLKYWTDKNGEPIKFIKIAGMHSELIGVSADGKLHQWKWAAESPFHLTINISTDQAQSTAIATGSSQQQTGQITVNHPKTLFLQLFNERICGMSTSNVRASCWTESGKIASWLDETIDIPATVKYQTPAQKFVQTPKISEGTTTTGSTTQLNTCDIILEMSTSNLFTLIRMSSGLIYWWGIMPFEQRAKLIEKYQSKQQKSKSSSSSSSTEISVGSYVSLKSLPLYNNGTVGFTVKDGMPRLGQINEHVFMLRDQKAFKFKTKPADSFIDINGQSVDMPPPPSPSDQPPLLLPTPLTGSLKRKKQYSSTSDLSASSPARSSPDDEEYWHLNDVVFVEDFKSSTILGKVIKVDNDYVLVQVAPKANASTSEVDSPAETLLLDNSRIFQKNQLQLVKQSSSLKLPDFMQKTPKKLSDFGAILTIAAHQNGLHAIITKENSLFYVQYDLLSNKITKEKRFTTSLNSFLGRNPGNISFFAQDNPSLNLTALFDGNSTIYPLDELSGSNTLKSPEWKNLFPVKCFTNCLLPPVTCRQNKQTVRKLQCVTFFAMRMEQLMASIFRCDYNRVVKIIRQLEMDLGIGNPNAQINTKRLKKILNERCDGNRNIFHAAVYVCAPVSNNTLNAIHNPSAGGLPSNNKATAGLQAGSQSNLRPSKFSDSGLSDIYAAYGTSGTSSAPGGGSSAQAKLQATIERPWSTSNKSSDVRKINISLEPKPQPQQHQQESAQANSYQSVSTSDSETASSGNNTSNNQTKAETPEDNGSSSNSTNKSGGIPTSFWPPLPPTSTNQATPDTNETQPANKFTQIWPAVKLTEKERKQNALKILQELLNTPVFQIQQNQTTTTPPNCDYLYELLSHKSADGQTPFMYAVNIRAYEAAIMLFDQSIKIRNTFVQNQLAIQSNQSGLNYTRDLLFTNLVFPLGSRTDQSPLYMLCSNDTCSFTWTGDNHITQDIFECRTCTLVGNLCCCTECARTCHKGHDCKIKTSSPTAYCDCWEKCKCKSLIAGDQEKRFGLLEKLLGETNLLTASFFKGESLLIYLAQTVSRQILEQRNYKRVSGTVSSNSSTASSNSSRNNRTGTGYGSNTESGSSNFGLTGSIGDMPQHDLEPPKFSRLALEKVFTDWYSVKQIFLFNKSRIESTSQHSTRHDSENDETKLPGYLFNNGSLLFDDSVYSDAQSGCVDLDKFIYILIMKCPSDLVTVLVDTIHKRKLATTDESSDDFKEVDFIARRLIRAVVRLFVILCIETAPSSLNANLSIGGGPTVTSLTPANTGNANNAFNRLMSPTKTAINSRLARFKSLSSGSSGNSGLVASLVTISPIAKCEYILRQFASYAVQELADNAHSIIMPVVLGLSKPSTFKLSGSGAGSGATFNNGNTASSNDYLSIGSGSNSSLGNTGGQYALAEEIFNLEASLHRQFTSSISTTLITPAPLVKKEPLQQQQPTAAAAAAQQQQQPKSSSFKNTFTEAVVSAAAPNARHQAADKSKVTEAKTSSSDVSMPPPAQSTSATSPSDASNQQQNMYIDSDTNQSSSSTSSHSSAGSATGNEIVSKSSKNKSHLTRSVSSNSDNSNSNSNSSSGGESSSSEANSSDTTTSLATASSNSTANTKRSTIAFKSGRTRSTKAGKKSSSSSSRRVVQFNTSFTRKSLEAAQSQDDFTDKEDDGEDDEEEGEEDEDDGEEENDEDEEEGEEDDEDESDIYDKYENEIMSPSNEEQESTQVNLEDDFISRANIEDATNSSEASSVNTNTAANINNNNNNSNGGNSSVNVAASGGSKRRRLLINRGQGMLSSGSGSNNANSGSSNHQIANDNSNASVQLANSRSNPTESNNTLTSNHSFPSRALTNSGVVGVSDQQQQQRRTVVVIDTSVPPPSLHNNTNNNRSDNEQNNFEDEMNLDEANSLKSTAGSAGGGQSNNLNPILNAPMNRADSRRSGSLRHQILPINFMSISNMIHQYNDNSNSSMDGSQQQQQQHRQSSITQGILLNQRHYEASNRQNSIQNTNTSTNSPVDINSSQHQRHQNQNQIHTTNTITNYSLNLAEPSQPFITNLVNNQAQQQHQQHHQYQHHHHQPHNVHQHHYNHVNILPTSNSSISGPIPQTEAVSSFNTPSSNAITNNTLGRVFSVLIKLIRELMNAVYAEKHAQLTRSNNQALIKSTKTISKSEKQRNQRLVFQALNELINEVNRKLDAPWRWLVSLMDATEAQLRFGASLSSSVGDFGNNTNALQYLRHLEERALLSNYFSNNCGNGYNYYASNNIGGSGPFVSSRFGSGIDARRKLNIMQHQHQQFASLHSNQASPLFPISNNNTNSSQPPNYYQSQTPSGQSSGFSGRASSSNNPAVPNTTDLGANSSQPPTNSSSSNQVTATSLASQFASAQILTTRKDFLSYTLSLMRTNSNEHRDSLPSIDISLLKHAAYILDGILFYLKCSSLSTQLSNDAATSTQQVSSSSANTTSTTTAGQAANVLFTLQNEYSELTDDNENDMDNSLDSENDSSDCDDEFNRYFGHDFADSTADASEDSSHAKDYNQVGDANSDTNEVDFDEDTASDGQFDTNDMSQEDEQPIKLKHVSQRDAPFFRRSSSTLCLGANAPDPFFYSLEEALPLATRPHLLQPHVRIQDMFRVRSNHIDQFLSLSRMGLMASDQRIQVPVLRGPSLFGSNPANAKSMKRKSRFNPSSKFGIKMKKIDLDQSSKASRDIKSKWNNNTSKFMSKFEARLFKIAQLQCYKRAPISQLSRPSELVDRWRLTVDLFGRVFCDDVGLEPGSLIRQLGGFQLKEAKFRREMERLRNTANRELLMEVERDRDQLLQMTFKSLNNMYNLQNNRRAAASASLSASSSSNLLPPLLCLNRIKVTFRDEQGEGSGVARSFYTAFCEAVLADLPLPNLDAFYNQTASLSNSASSLGNVSYVPFNMLHRYRNTRNLDLSARRQANSVPSTPISSSSSVISGVMTAGSAQLNRSTSSLRSRDSTPTGGVSNTSTGGLDSQGAEQQMQHSPTITASLQSTNTVPLSINAPAFFSPLIAITSTSTNLTDLPSFDMFLYNSLDSQHREYGQQLYTRINQHLSVNTNNSQQQQSSSSSSYRAARITGMILELRSSQIQQIVNSDQILRARIEEGLNLLAGSNSSTVSPQILPSQEMTTTSSAVTTPTYQSVVSQLAPAKPLDNTPLFWQPDKTMAGAGFFSPRAGHNSQPRLNAFRNVGRIMAICLLQNELCPITLSRHCIKYILGRPIRWHDLAFFDSQMYESFRKMIKDAENVLVSDVVQAKQSDHKTVRAALMATISRVNEDMFKPLDLTFNIDLPKEEGGHNNDLVENGSKIEVTCVNMYEFVKKYAEFRMVKNAEMCLQELKNGVYDVLPTNAFEGLTAEDFRLLLNGVADISIHTLASYTTISDESKESNRRPQFEKWFWATLEKMNFQEKQELLFFWTGSPYLPASEEGFQPLPTVTLRPPSDQHLPTANTCINRLYLPMYSSKSILKAKILQAIKTKTFGFV